MSLSFALRSIGLVLLGLLVYGQTFHFDFVFDDHLFIVNNPFIKNFTNFHLIWKGFSLTRLVGMYSFALNYGFNQLRPGGYHVFNVCVHLGAAFLVWALGHLIFKITSPQLLKDRWGKELPYLIAVLFLVHPAQTQAVTYITQRFESMATVFYLGTVYCYLRGRLSGAWPRQMAWFACAGLLFGLGLLTKEVIITVPAMLVACEAIFFPVKDPRRLLALGAAGFVLAYLSIIKIMHINTNIFHQPVWLFPIPSESHDGDVFTPPQYMLTQMRVFLTFLRLLILPVHQNLDYDYPASRDLFHPPLTVLGLVVILSIIVLIFKWRRTMPAVAFGLAWALITFSANLVPRSNVIFEHKFYLISFGFLLSGVAVFSRRPPYRGVLVRLLICLAALWALMSFHRNQIWANELLVWENGVQNSPNKARVNANLGRVYGSMGRYDESIQYLSRSIALKPDNITYENRGIIYGQMGRMHEALEDMDKSIAMDPGYLSTYVKRSWIYQSLHLYSQAFADLDYVISQQPYFVDAYVERGILWMALNQPQKALPDFQQAVVLQPRDYELFLKRGAVYYALGTYDLALQDFSKALALEPTSQQAAQNIKACLTQLARPPQ